MTTTEELSLEKEVSINTNNSDRAKVSVWTNLFLYLYSPIPLALALILFTNCWLCLTQPFNSVDPALLPAVHTWTWWATREYLQYKPAPPVVLLGSSLFMHPISRQDADFLEQDFDYVHHHYSLYMGKQLEKRFHLTKPPICFNFSLPGDLVSDDYMIAQALLRGDHKPKQIIIGLSLRDFIDNVVNCPGSTPPFRYLRRFVDIDNIVDFAFPKFWQRCDYYFGKSFYPWAKRLDIQVLASEQCKNIFGPIANKYSTPSLLNDLDYRKHVPANLHSEVEEGMAIIKAHMPYNYDDNYADYRRRYGNNRSSNTMWMFNIQKQFFIRLLAFCKEENIALTIVNMPLTKENFALMPEGIYARYINLLQSEANHYGFVFLDLNQRNNFVHTDFYDTAHMNSSGGKKLLDILANEIQYNF